MGDRQVVIYDGGSRPSEEHQLLEFAVLPAIGCGVLWTYWLQNEVALVWQHPSDHIGYTLLITSIAVLVFGAFFAFVGLLAFAVFCAARAAVRLAARALLRVARVFAR